MDIRVGTQDAEGTPWSVLSDLAITIVLVLVVFIVLQFVQTFRERAINTELFRRQSQVREALMQASKKEWQVRVDSLAPDRQRVVFSTEVLFETCQATLKEEGVVLLQAVGRVLGARSALFESIQVEGHTDRRPIRSLGANCPYPSNWELSSARATRVVSLFSAGSLVANELLSAIGRAEYHPVDTVSLDPNRRIELILQYDRAQVARRLLREPARLSSASPAGAPSSTDQPLLTGDQWLTDPSIRAIGVLYQRIESIIKDKSMQRVYHNYCDGLSVELYKSVDGALAKLKLLSEGSEHLRAGAHYYYEAGRLRFSFRWLRADNDTHEETRSYFSEEGALLHRDVRRLSGPGYPGGFWDEIHNPEQYVAQACSPN